MASSLLVRWLLVSRDQCTHQFGCAAAAGGGGAGVDWRPHQASALHRVEGGGLGNVSHPCSQGHMGAVMLPCRRKRAPSVSLLRSAFKSGTHCVSLLSAWHRQTWGDGHCLLGLLCSVSGLLCSGFMSNVMAGTQIWCKMFIFLY